MPLSLTERQRIANGIVASTLRIRLHVGDPGADGTANRVTNGEGAFVNGVEVAAAGWSNADANGEVSNVGAIDFGTAATTNPGTITWASAFRGNVYVGSRKMASTTVNAGSSYQIPAGAYKYTVNST